MRLRNYPILILSEQMERGGMLIALQAFKSQKINAISWNRREQQQDF
jgi:hypothetical protein